jgi:hypothetical protein
MESDCAGPEESDTGTGGQPETMEPEADDDAERAAIPATPIAR